MMAMLRTLAEHRALPTALREGVGVEGSSEAVRLRFLILGRRPEARP
jgi:hypothetical protein